MTLAVLAMLAAPRCGAKRRRLNATCQSAKPRNARHCRFHGGHDLTENGKQSLRKLRWKTGSRSKRLQSETRALRETKKRELATLLPGAKISVTVKATASEPPADWVKE